MKRIRFFTILVPSAVGSIPVQIFGENRKRIGMGVSIPYDLDDAFYLLDEKELKTISAGVYSGWVMYGIDAATGRQFTEFRIDGEACPQNAIYAVSSNNAFYAQCYEITKD